jgi:5-formyltetrahydrofolate cyclo-ligase
VDAASPNFAAKLSLRDQLQTTRSRRSLLEGGEAARSLADVLLATPEVRRAATIAVYVALPGEPGTGPLIDALADRRVILPITLPDNDLDWATYDGDLIPGRRGILEPGGRRLGVEAIATADVVLVPALAVDRSGNRLGKGAGCYDRALGRVPVGTFVCALVFDDEVLDAVPTDAHDRPVTAAATPSGVVRFP